ncbi:glycoside hydrolase family 95 protein [Purpureocillium lavendulum]|uniref:Glycoside hydrolase family 95 protein n=1 Tax=Purpureocillium lavendulum TaxID=1247861 RepID=A0AB34FDZ3_9HYPO|nr:glycoside hydrolase family 95 protein [Purpureocillium lavendulum]
MSAHRLRYRDASTTFATSLPLGNGRLGANVQSSPSCERFILNDVTFWSGRAEPARAGLSLRGDPNAELRRTQQCFLDGNFAEGHRRARCYESEKRNFGTNMLVGSLNIDIAGHESVDNFERELNLHEAAAVTRYKKDGYLFARTAFLSHAHQVLAVRFETAHPAGIELVVGVQGTNDAFTCYTDGDKLHFDTQALETAHSDGTCGVKGHGVIAVRAMDGKVVGSDGKLHASRSRIIAVLLTFNTTFQSGDKFKEVAQRQISKAMGLTVDKLLAAHLADYQPLYDRTSLTLGPQTVAADVTITERREKGKSDDFANDPEMFALYFHYARYLTIAGTREDSPLPLHLQGLWNDGEAARMGWSCDYHLDINTQMNYFPTIPTGLPEMMQPMIAYLAKLAASGRDTARTVYGCDGWVAHVFSNVWGFTDPGWEMQYGMNVTGGLWMATHLIELYEYTRDRAFLGEYAYPILKGAAEFFLDYMTQDPESGWLLGGPSVSPENSFMTDVDGEKREHCLHLSPTLDVVLVRDLFRFILHACAVLAVDSGLAERVKTALPKLPPLQVGKMGQLQEWVQDFDEAQPFHRHMSHTMALCRSAQISARHTPDLANAVAVTLARRRAHDDLEDIEFTAALFAQNYARLGDSAGAVSQIGHLIGELSFDNLLSYSKPGVAGAEASIFVIDGNFGAAAAMAEMLVRSVMLDLDGPVEVDLLPALPAGWPEGKATGLLLRGGLTIDLEWGRGKLVKAVFQASAGGSTVIYYNERSVKVEYKTGDAFMLGPSLQKW